VRECLRNNFASFSQDSASSIEELAKEISIDSMDQEKDEYVKYCFYEAMRIEPPLPVSTSIMLTETQDI
jgi:hypothetical protein